MSVCICVCVCSLAYLPSPLLHRCMHYTCLACVLPALTLLLSSWNSGRMVMTQHTQLCMCYFIIIHCPLPCPCPCPLPCPLSLALALAFTWHPPHLQQCRDSDDTMHTIVHISCHHHPLLSSSLFSLPSSPSPSPSPTLLVTVLRW